MACPKLPAEYYFRKTDYRVFSTVTVDPDGNLTSDGRFQYSWDGENRLISSTPLVPSATSKKVEFSYDYMNRKTSCKIYNWTGLAWELGVTEKYAWDGMTQIAVFDASNVLKESYLWGEDLSGTLQGAGGVGGLLAVKDSSGTYIPAYDGSGNIAAYVDASTGAKVAEIEYDAFGRQIVKSGVKANDFRFGFSTKPYRKETGMIEYEQRPYIPEIRRFPTRDPLGEQGGNNPYSRTNNDLINKYDGYSGLTT
jgi:RHS repeat-associated protein